jgi:NAD(P)-dependent dehydrogenase (short-subunit alcohol dehydrogenase family)
MNLRSKVAVVTGAASGIVEKLQRTFWVDGANVVLANLNQAGAAVASARLGDTDNAIGVGMDITDETQVEAGIAAAVATFGVSTCWSATRASTWAADRPVGAAEMGIRRLRKPCLLPRTAGLR